MQKIPTIFERDWNGTPSLVLDKPNPDCDWVFKGEGWPTQKLDGTCAMMRDGKLYKRREVKKGKPTPEDFELVSFDEKTGKRVGWVPVGDGPEDQFFHEALSRMSNLQDGTYELIGPKVQGNTEHWPLHELIAHDALGLRMLGKVPRDFEGLRDWLCGKDMEGIVFHHEDGRMAKIKLRDFGLRR